MFFIYYLSLTFFVLALLGTITLVIYPAERVTVGNVLLFVVGALIGAIALLNAGARLGGLILQSLHIRITNLHSADPFGYFLLFIGAELGGLAAVLLRRRSQIRRASRSDAP